MIDGLGLVFEQQGNTGAAAYNQPVLQPGNTSADKIAGALQAQVMNEREQKKLDEKVTAQKKAAAAEAMKPKSQRSWVDDTPWFGDNLNKMKDDFAGLINRGIAPDDYNNAEARAYQDKIDDYNNKIAISQQHETEYPRLLEQIKVNPLIDATKSLAKLETWRALPKEDRFKTQLADQIVMKEKPYDQWSALEGFDISKFTDTRQYNKADGSASQRTVLDEADLRAEMKTIANNPLYDEDFKIGVDKGKWKDRQDYENQLFAKAKLQFSLDRSTTEAPLPAPTEEQELYNGDLTRLRQIYGLGLSPANVHSAAGSDQTNEMMLDNTVDVGTLNATIPRAAAIDADTGKQIVDETTGKPSTGVINIVSGKMSTPIVLKGTNKVMSFKKGKDAQGNPVYSVNVYDRKLKKNVPLEAASQKELEKQLIKADYAEYTPMILGEYYKEDGVTAGTAWVPVSAAATTTESKDLSMYKAAKILLTRIAAEENYHAHEN
tara:strand:+ start:10071 stop:11543 length:1473 start_codon:yes stop_codon:yes gene_type:complete